jgi:hypothetical protein
LEGEEGVKIDIEGRTYYKALLVILCPHCTVAFLGQAHVIGLPGHHALLLDLPGHRNVLALVVNVSFDVYVRLAATHDVIAFNNGLTAVVFTGPWLIFPAQHWRLGHI